MKFNEEPARAGAEISLDGLHPPTRGARVSFREGSPTVTDGPFAEVKEVIGGYWIIDVKSKEEAIEWAKKCPVAKGDVIEIRQIFQERSEEHTSELQSRGHLVCRLLLEKTKKAKTE